MARRGNRDKTITIYCHWKRDDGLVKPVRRLLKGSWKRRGISAALQTGNILKEPSSIRIFCADNEDITYIPPHEWYKLPEEELDKYWTADIELSAKPMIMQFESDFELDFDEESKIIKAENDYIRKTPGAMRIVQCDDNREPSGSHIRLQA